MPIVRSFARVFGWLLTPVVAWIASFLGSWIAASLTSRDIGLKWRLGVIIGTGALAATLSAILWLRLIRRSPTLRSALAVHPDGTPVAADASPQVGGGEEREDRESPSP